ncbi:MAG TPA: O-antigen ligase family protein [Verrucomicrobiae bacterium]|jgi:O-antigen ligase|nr:O-antigen ligase family protein [Verrucomicrobiae bacterium]
MPPILALSLTLVFVTVLFVRDIREKANVTRALWLPFFWITICGGGSRYFSQWINMFGFHAGAISVEDGSPVDAAFNAALIVGGLVVLQKRRVSIARFVRNNQWLTIYMLYCLLAITWSDFPFVSAKRWTKLIGNPVMALVLLTEPAPMEALTRLIKRCAYFLLPLSVTFIKYFPFIGRTFNDWTGAPSNTGVATNKNELGFDCWILGTVLVWHMLHVFHWEKGKARRDELILCSVLMGMNLWLLRMAHSASSGVAFAISIGIILFLGFRWVNKRSVGFYILAGATAVLVLFFGFGMSDTVIHLLGRNDTLTGRTDIWQALWHWDINPVVGAGYEGFWLGDRRVEIQETVLPFLNEAHNGYLETYLNLGFVGVVLTVAVILSAYAKSRRALFRDFDFGRLRLAYLIAFVVYNWTEAAFRMNSFPFFMFFLVSIDYPLRRAAVTADAGLFQEGPVLVAPRPQFYWS